MRIWNDKQCNSKNFMYTQLQCLNKRNVDEVNVVNIISNLHLPVDGSSLNFSASELTDSRLLLGRMSCVLSTILV